jgi:hypothetical protein
MLLRADLLARGPALDGLLSEGKPMDNGVLRLCPRWGKDGLVCRKRQRRVRLEAALSLPDCPRHPTAQRVVVLSDLSHLADQGSRLPQKAHNRPSITLGLEHP